MEFFKCAHLGLGTKRGHRRREDLAIVQALPLDLMRELSASVATISFGDRTRTRKNGRPHHDALVGSIVRGHLKKTRRPIVDCFLRLSDEFNFTRDLHAVFGALPTNAFSNFISILKYFLLIFCFFFLCLKTFKNLNIIHIFYSYFYYSFLLYFFINKDPCFHIHMHLCIYIALK